MERDNKREIWMGETDTVKHGHCGFLHRMLCHQIAHRNVHDQQETVYQSEAEVMPVMTELIFRRNIALYVYMVRVQKSETICENPCTCFFFFLLFSLI